MRFAPLAQCDLRFLQRATPMVEGRVSNRVQSNDRDRLGPSQWPPTFMSLAEAARVIGFRSFPTLAAYTSRARAFWAILAVLLVSFCGVSAGTLIELRQETWDQATTGARNLVSVLSQEIARNLRTYDALLLRLKTEIRDPALDRLSHEAQYENLFQGTFVDPFLTDVFVTNAAGRVVWDRNGPQARNRDFSTSPAFTIQRDTVDAGLFMSAPFSRPDNLSDKVVAISRRVNARDGSFGGIVVGLVRMELFLRATRGTILGADDSITLFTAAGTLVARTPNLPEMIGRDLSGTPNVARMIDADGGVFSGISSIDGVRRIYTFTHIRDVPIILTVALGEKSVLSGWNRRALKIGLVLTLLSGLALTLALFVRREFRRRLETENTLRRSEEQYRLLADHSTDLIIRLDRDFNRRYVSPASRSLVGFEPEELYGQPSRGLIHPDDWSHVERIARNARQSAGGTEATYRLRTKSGGYIWAEGRYSYVPNDGGFIVVLRDVSERKQVEEELAAAHAKLTNLVNTDPLTGLSNRRHFDEMLEALGRRADPVPVSMLMMDIDRFKLFNDRYGHPEGDACLKSVARAIQGVAEAEGAVPARIGGEEMALLLPNRSLAEAQALAERIRAAVEALAIAHEGNVANGGVVTVSIGCAERDSSQSLMEPLIGEADQMLYEAKRSGRNRVESRLTLARAASAGEGVTDERRDEAAGRFRAAKLSAGPGELDTLATRLAELLEAPVGFISLYDRDEVELVGRHNIARTTASKDISFCRYTVLSSEPIVISDMATDPRFAENPLVTCDRGARFYAAAPLIDPRSGVAIGAISVCDAKPRYLFGPDERSILTTFARLVMHGVS